VQVKVLDIRKIGELSGSKSEEIFEVIFLLHREHILQIQTKKLTKTLLKQKIKEYLQKQATFKLIGEELEI